MALFVDGPACAISDLTDQDAGLLEVSLSTGINLSTKLRLTVEEIRSELQLWLQRPRQTPQAVWGPRYRIDQVVATASLARWEAMHALALVYRDAWFSQLVDRYQAKWQEYSSLARATRESYLAGGIGMVADPVKQAGPPVLSTTPGPQGGGIFYASVAWVNAAGQEGLPSFASSLTVTDGNLLSVGVTGAPVNAVGFNVYAGTSLDALWRQNNVALPLADSYLYVPGEVTGGALPGSGQVPDFTLPGARTILRG
ncbi:MAG: hypothetical protein M3N93_02845 [Acidobacteriota bacterium]|nr:hypothetical protein [Acidobacteriota bacterium]